MSPVSDTHLVEQLLRLVYVAARADHAQILIFIAELSQLTFEEFFLLLFDGVFQHAHRSEPERVRLRDAAAGVDDDLGARIIKQRTILLYGSFWGLCYESKSFT